jgi:hypothetical protein
MVQQWSSRIEREGTKKKEYIDTPENLGTTKRLERFGI